jgi:hypothetical protein
MSKRKTKYLKATKTNLKKYNLDFSKVVINSDGSIDYDGNVYLEEKDLKKIPFKFNKVDGDFSCSYNQLTSLEGSPKEVSGDFLCIANKLTSLEGAPVEVGGGFWCYDNELTSYDGKPEYIEGEFYD